MNEFIIAAGFEIDAESDVAAQNILIDHLGEFNRTRNGSIRWWIAEDDRIDGSDNDSVVFVRKGEQQSERRSFEYVERMESRVTAMSSEITTIGAVLAERTSERDALADSLVQAQEGLDECTKLADVLTDVLKGQVASERAERIKQQDRIKEIFDTVRTFIVDQSMEDGDFAKDMIALGMEPFASDREVEIDVSFKVYVTVHDVPTSIEDDILADKIGTTIENYININVQRFLVQIDDFETRVEPYVEDVEVDSAEVRW